MLKKLAIVVIILIIFDWEILKDDCEELFFVSIEKYKLLIIEYKEIFCKLLIIDEGNIYIDEEVKNFVKDKFFIYFFVLIIIFILLWIFLGFILIIYYFKKVRKYILIE